MAGPVRRVISSLGSLGLIAATTWLCYSALHLNATTVGFAYIVVVLLIATFLGTPEALGASLLAVVCFNFFFLPPVLTFTIADPQNWAALFALLSTALVASRLAARAKQRTNQAKERRQEMELLYTLSRMILLSQPGESLPKRLTFELARVFQLPAVILYDAHTGEEFAAGPDEIRTEALGLRLREAAVSGTSFVEAVPGVQVFAVRLGGRPIGSLALRGAVISETAIEALLNLVAIALERMRGQELAMRAATERESEILKSTLLDAIAHEFKTPLTSIKAAASGMLLSPETINERVRNTAAIISEEADRLERLVTDAIQMARIEAGKLKVQREAADVRGMVARVIAQLQSSLDGHDVVFSGEGLSDSIYADPELIELALRHVLDNAAKYSEQGSKIEITARSEDGHVLIEVRDSGPGIPEDQQGRIFDKFYRSPQTSGNTPGTGMGLNIVRQIVKAHGGSIWVESKPGEGSRFSLSLPAAVPEHVE